MSDAAQFVLYLLAAISFFAAMWAHRAPQPAAWWGRGFFIALGLLFWVLVPLIVTAHKL